ncbi:MAG: polysaccharide biosynthesis tyrosine autokinase [Ginsengibacter sp.]
MHTQNSTPKNSPQENTLIQLVMKYVPYWPMFIILLFICLTVGFLYLRYTTPMYEADASLIVKDSKKGYEDSKVVESLDALDSKKLLDNEIEIIQSRSVMMNVVKKLDLYASIYQKGKIQTILAYNSAPVSIKAQEPDSLKGVSNVFIKLNKDNTITISTDSVKIKYQLNEWVNTPYGVLKFIPNELRNVYDTTKPLFFNLSNPRNVAQSFLGNLAAYASGKTSTIINLSFVDEDPGRAEDILNEVLNSYSNSGLLEKSDLAKNTLDFVEERLAIVTHELDSIEGQIQHYKSGAGAANLSSQSELFLQNVSDNDQKLSEVNNQLSVLNEVENFVQNDDNTNGIVPSTLGVSDPTLNSLVGKLYNTELEYAKLKTTVGENNPMLGSVSDQIKKIKPDIIKNIQSQRRSLEASKNSLYSTNGSYNSVLERIPAKERQLVEISRAQSIKSSIYSFLLQKREESQLSYAGASSDSKIVDRALASHSPVSPKRSLIYLMCLITAFVIPVAYITIRDAFNGKVLYRSEIEASTSFPVLAEINFQKSKSPIVIEAGKRTFSAEEFRKLRVALSFLGLGEHAKKLLITSSISGEGKSFVAANLAISLSLTGKKVVLVDLDMNNPSLGEILNIEEEPGVSDYLTGDKEPEEIIRRIKDHENLFFIPAGTLPDNPSELLSNGKAKDFISYLENLFDFVVIDTAPVALVTDANLLSEYCDATLYIVRHKYTPKILVKRIDENNRINPLSNPAIIFNAIKSRGFIKNNTGYGYGYSYVYGDKKRTQKRKKINI